LLMMPGLHIL